MKKFIFSVVVLCLISSCSEDDVEYIYLDDNNPSGYVEGEYLKQVGDINSNGVALALPIQTKNISTNNHHTDIVLYQNGVQLSGGPFALEEGGAYWYANTYDTTGGNPVNGNNNISAELYVMETPTSPRVLMETLQFN